MNRSVVAGVVLAFLLVVAGCMGGGGATPETAVGDDATTTVDATDDGAETTTAGADPEAERLDVSNVLASHRDRLRSAGTFTLYERRTISMVDDESSNVVEETSKYDLEAGRLFVTREPEGGSTSASYVVSNGTWYTRSTEGDVRTRQRESGPDLGMAVEPYFFDVAAGTNLTYQGRGTREGVSGRVYTANGVESFTDSIENVLDPDEITGYEIALVVSDDGLVRYLRVSLTQRTDDGQKRTTTVRKYTDLGSTTVSPPDWVPESDDE